ELQRRYARRVSAWPREALDQTQPDRIRAHAHDDGDGRGRLLGRPDTGARMRHEHGRVEPDQLGGERRKTLVTARRPAIFDRDGLSFLVPKITKPLTEGLEVRRVVFRGREAKEPDPVHLRRLLPLGRERRGERPNQRGQQEAAAVHHSSTWSARASSEGGIVRPSALAVLRLMTRSNFVGCSTGRSAGLAPLRILST